MHFFFLFFFFFLSSFFSSLFLVAFFLPARAVVRPQAILAHSPLGWWVASGWVSRWVGGDMGCRQQQRFPETKLKMGNGLTRELFAISERAEWRPHI